jgi:predicted RNase H-like nuclease
MREVTMIGLDCATDDAKVGAALGKWRDGALSVQRVTLCDRLAPAVVVRGWLGKADEPVLLALDAPLGWPAPLAQTLVRHRAGDELSAGADQMFRRMTDRAIHKNVGKTPLDVGADRIARTAHAALRVLGELRRALSRPVPLAWSAHALGGITAIEVYPAATLRAHAIRSAGYKKPEHVAERREILDALRTRLSLPDDVGLLEGDADALDAVVCLLAAKGFVEGQAVSPHDAQLAEQESWIWSRGRSREG